MPGNDQTAPGTREATAVNGHLLIYRIIAPTFPGGEEVLSQWDAEHSPRCPCHTAEDAEPLPDC